MLSGTVSKEYGDGKIRFEVTWQVDNQYTTGNSSRVRWTCKAYLLQQYSFYPELGNVKISFYVNGELEDSTSNFTFSAVNNYQTVGCGVGEFSLSHTATNGTMESFDFTYKAEINATFGTTGVYLSTVEVSGTDYINTPSAYPIITNIPNFTDEESPTIVYSGASKSKKLEVCISFTGEKDDIPYRVISTSPLANGTYIFEFTEADKEILRAKLGEGYTSIPVKFILRTTEMKIMYGDITATTYVSATLTFVNYEPLLVPTVEDINSRTLRVTGNKNTFVRYFSNASFTTGAEARKGASITNQYVKNGDIIAGNVYEGIIEGITSNTFYFSATDNRDYTTRDAIVVNFIPYIKLTCNVKTEELTALGELTVNVSGKYYNGSFGKMNNSLELEYGLTENEGDIEWHPLGAVNPTVDNEGNYSYTFTITGLNHESRYTLIVNAIDEVMPQPSTAYKVIATIPVFDWGENDFKHYTDVYLEPGKSLRATSAAGKDMELVAVSDNGSVDIGYGNYVDNEGTTTIYGNEVNILTNGSFTINGTTFGESQVLWEGASHMNGNQTAQLSQSIAQQSHGIVLVFSLYRNGAAADASFNTFYISKKEVALLPNAPHTFLLGINSGFSLIGAKYLYIDNNVITGNATNTSSGTNSGITFDNSQFVLRYVIGV